MATRGAVGRGRRYAARLLRRRNMDVRTGILLPTRRTSGRAMSRRERQTAPFLAFIDHPIGPELPSHGGVCRIGGWIASGRGRSCWVAVQVAGRDPATFEASNSRPDVLTALRSDYPIEDPHCGFEFSLEVPDTPGGATVTLELTDGEFVASVGPYRVQKKTRAATTRGDYKTVWNSVSEELDDAKMAVTCYTDEEEYSRTAEQTVRALQSTVGIDGDDVVLEIGAGIGRIGRALAPLCKCWIGTDVSENMLRHAAHRLSGLENVGLVVTSGWDLAPIASESVDVVYCTVVFMHLDEWDRFRYVREGLRVLRPGGRMHVDNFNLIGEEGWKFFLEIADNVHPLDRLPNISKSSTGDELSTYFERVGFTDIDVHTTDWWVLVSGRKPAPA